METVKVKVLKTLFKNGAEVAPGKKMDMEIQTAFRFQQAGDVEILDEIVTEVQEVQVARKA